MARNTAVSIVTLSIYTFPCACCKHTDTSKQRIPFILSEGKD